MTGAVTFRVAIGGLAAALAACGHAPPAVGPASPATSPPTLSAPAAPSPGAGAAQVNPHDQDGKPGCRFCHGANTGAKPARDSNSLCAACHRFGHRNHPVDVVQAAGAKELPLLEGGRVACHSCHDPHHPKAALRKPFNDLCVSCHVVGKAKRG